MTYPKHSTPVKPMRSKGKPAQWPALPSPVFYDGGQRYFQDPWGVTYPVPPLAFKTIPSGVSFRIRTGGKVSNEARRHWRRSDHPWRTRWLSFHWHVLRRRPMR